MLHLSKHSASLRHGKLLRYTLRVDINVTCCYYSSIPVTNEPHLASRESKSVLISGGDSS